MAWWTKHWEDIRPQLKYEAGRWILLKIAESAVIGGLFQLYLRFKHSITDWYGFVAVTAIAFLVFLLLERPKKPGLIQQEGGQALVPAGEVAQDVRQIDVLYNKIDVRLTGEVETAIRGQAAKVAAGDRENWLIHGLVIGYIYFDYERIWFSIFGSQIGALQKLNDGAMRRQDLVPLYAVAAQLSPAVYTQYSFDQWIGYMRSQTLIREDGEFVSITVKGRDFLKFLIDEGRSSNQRAN